MTSIYSPAPETTHASVEDLVAIYGVELRKVEDLLHMGFTTCNGQNLLERRKFLVDQIGVREKK